MGFTQSRGDAVAEGYASFKTDKGMIVSTKKFKSHAEVAKWVAAELKTAA